MDPSPKVKEIKAKTNKWDLIKLKSIGRAKKTINKMNGVKFANDMINKGLISNIYKHAI